MQTQNPDKSDNPSQIWLFRVFSILHVTPRKRYAPLIDHL